MNLRIVLEGTACIYKYQNEVFELHSHGWFVYSIHQSTATCNQCCFQLKAHHFAQINMETYSWKLLKPSRQKDNSRAWIWSVEFFFFKSFVFTCLQNVGSFSMKFNSKSTWKWMVGIRSFPFWGPAWVVPSVARCIGHLSPGVSNLHDWLVDGGTDEQHIPV